MAAITTRATMYPITNCRKVKLVSYARPGMLMIGEGTGLGRDDGQRDRPPGHAAVRQEIVLERLIATAEAQPE